ncbi:Maph68 [Matsumuraeses phaseoli granulovirus]|uniref:Maph68 n=1 Tax=Matsumuraeses phaseoli granulovirus TaxID=2760664 RepID=A0AAE7SYA7_9BBAC|nr:Maph68 [Matsumuraeses phaseoli granulovirus]QOD40031.1 Maph68 [Matsumuraeses phaseoli granulovirus]
MMTNSFRNDTKPTERVCYICGDGVIISDIRDQQAEDPAHWFECRPVFCNLCAI